MAAAAWDPEGTLVGFVAEDDDALAAPRGRGLLEVLMMMLVQIT